MTRSEEIRNAIRIKEQAKTILDIDHNNKRADLVRQIHLLNAELQAIVTGKIPDAAITL